MKTSSFEKNKKDILNAKDYKSVPKFFENQIAESERLLTKQEIADFLRVSIKMIDRKVSLNEIPFFKIGRLVRFSKKEVLAWAEGTISKR